MGTTIRCGVLCAAFVLLAAAGAAAVPSDVVYTEGEASVRYGNGRVDEASIGDMLNTGDTVRTGYDGFVELDQAGLSLKINADTVFTLQEKEQAGKTTGVFSVALGSIRFRYNRLTGREPLIQTGSCVAGVRGTEFSVFAGADGSSLIVVDSGRVTVEAAGREVELAQDEGVEVRLGEPPGEKFKAQRGQLDYRTWNDGKIEELLRDPADAVEKVGQRMDQYIRDVSEYYALYVQYKDDLDRAREKGSEIQEREGQEAAQKYQRENVAPLADKARASFVNFRYFSLAALSLRRYVAGRMYLMLKARHINDPSDSSFRAFEDRFYALLDSFERSIVPRLVEADI